MIFSLLLKGSEEYSLNSLTAVCAFSNFALKKLKNSFWVDIPNAFYKIYVGKKEDGSLKTLAFIIPQSVKPNDKIEKYQVTIDTIEKQSGFDFLYKLEDRFEHEIEAGIEKDEWF